LNHPQNPLQSGKIKKETDPKPEIRQPEEVIDKYKPGIHEECANRAKLICNRWQRYLYYITCMAGALADIFHTPGNV